MGNRDRLIELFKKTEYTPFPEMTMTANLGNQFTDYGLNCIVDSLLANGVIVPPCKVGDIVWSVFTPKYPANSNDYGKWFMRVDGVQRIILGKKGLSIETWNMGTIPAKELGKKLFLTKEEAEAELRKRSDNNA